MALIIEKKHIKDFVKQLRQKFIVIDSTKKNGILPEAKKHVFPPKQEIFKFYAEKGYADNPIEKKKFVIFGLNPADLRAIVFLDKIMKTPEPDFFYFQKRKKTIIIGLSDYSLDSMIGGDIIFEKINPKQYQVLFLSNKGRKLSKNKFFKKIKNPKIKKYLYRKTPLDKMLLDPELLSDAVDWSRNHKIWEELEKKCLGCGNCSYVCPLCYCFSMEDKISLDDKECVRCRLWDSCTLPEFAEVAGGHDFHKGVKERYYNWFYHKFVRGYKEYGRSLCVACNRCQKYCPAEIDIEKILLKIVKDYKHEKSL
ncbi:4Fe-4S dicluster domain-containing protein [Patescibacteria group bacterium]